MNEMQRMLRQVFRTKNQMTLAVSGTGSAGMEAAVVNLIEPGDSMVVCVNGVFGERMADVAERAGAKVTKRRAPLGRGLHARRSARRRWPRPSPRSSASSWPRLRPAPGSRSKRSRKLVHDAGALLLVDAVTSLGGVPVEVDALGHRRDLLRHAEVPELPAGPGAGLVQPAGDGRHPQPQDEGAELVSRRDDAGQVLGQRARLPPHRADQHDLRACTKPCGWSSKKGWKPASPGTC